MSKIKEFENIPDIDIEGEETLEEQLNHNLDQLEQMHPAAEITGKEILR